MREKVTENLKPCPFCGGQAYYLRDPYDAVCHFTTTCDGCDATGPKCNSRQEAVEALNERTTQ